MFLTLRTFLHNVLAETICVILFSICLVANTLKETKWFFQYVNVNLWCLASTIMPEASNKNAILEAGKAFESTMKIICDKQGYAYDKNKDTAQKLITILENNGFYPSYMNAHLTSVRTTLETGLPVVRNKVAGQGQGNQIITIPDEYTDYALHLAATNILFLVRLYRNKKQNP